MECNPVFLEYVLLTMDECFLFVDLFKLDDTSQNLMKRLGVDLKPYHSFFDHLGMLRNQSILIAPNCNQSIFEAVKNDNTIMEKPVSGHLMKAVKNETEQEGFETVMVRDWVALVKFLHRPTHAVGTKIWTNISSVKKYTVIVQRKRTCKYYRLVR